MKASSTVYVGNVSFYTTERQLLDFFAACGPISNLHIGLNSVSYHPCGFCFVEYAKRSDAALAINTLNRSVMDGQVIRVDWDWGFEPRRQFGRGRTGGQVRDDVRMELEQEKGVQDVLMKEVKDHHKIGEYDRPLVTYSHMKRDYVPRRRPRS